MQTVGAHRQRDPNTGSRLTRISPSAIGRYLTCPKQFRLADLERVSHAEEPSPVLCQANALHAALDKFFGLPTEHRTQEMLERALRSVWASHRRPGTFAGRDEERHYGLDALALLREFHERFDSSVVPLSREQWVSARIDGVTTVFGKVDRIDEAPGGGLTVIDYKTGRRQLDPNDIPHDPAALVYLVGTEATYGLEVEQVRFIYLRSGDEVRWTPEREDVEQARRRLAHLLTVIDADVDLVATPGSHCRFCPFALRCDERQRVDPSSLVPVGDLGF